MQADDAGTPLSDFEQGLLLGILVGEGHFGGDGRQPQVTVRMHTRHERLFRWLERRIPGSRLYGPYEHGGRAYYQWMARGPALCRVVVPLVSARIADFDAYAAARFAAMCERYGIHAGPPFHAKPDGETASLPAMPGEERPTSPPDQT